MHDSHYQMWHRIFFYVKKHYSFQRSKEDIYANIRKLKLEFDAEIFVSSFNKNYSNFFNLYVRNEYVWKIIKKKNILDETINSIYEFNEFCPELNMQIFNNLSDSEISIFIDIQNMLLASLFVYDIGDEISDLAPDNVIANTKDANIRYYRGLSDYNYGVLPTMFRNVNPPSNGVIDFSYIYDAYKKANLETRYADRIGNVNDVYSYCAFMQHAREFSPLLDFTEEKNIAISFATSSVNDYNSYLSKDAAVLEINIPENMVVTDTSTCNSLIKSIDIFKCKNKKLSYNTLIRGKLLSLCTAKDFEAQAYLIDLKTNDRMRYQKGCFLLFTKAVITSEDVLIPAGLSTCITKHKIEKSNKKKLYEGIEKDKHWLDVDHLMNPYKYFAEAPIEW